MGPPARIPIIFKRYSLTCTFHKLVINKFKCNTNIEVLRDIEHRKCQGNWVEYCTKGMHINIKSVSENARVINWMIEDDCKVKAMQEHVVNTMEIMAIV